MNLRHDLIQGTQEWHDWRRQGLGASDAPIVLDISPYKRPLELWQEKTGLVVPDDKWKYIFERGHKIEAAARAYFEIMNDRECPPVCMDMTEHPFIKASLDGYNASENFILEIKYVGRDAMDDEIPRHHYAQLQHQMMVSGAKDVTYIRSNTGEEFKSDVVERDEIFIENLLATELKFWDMVTNKIEPVQEPRVRKKRSKKN